MLKTLVAVWTVATFSTFPRLLEGHQQAAVPNRPLFWLHEQQGFAHRLAGYGLAGSVVQVSAGMDGRKRMGPLPRPASLPKQLVAQKYGAKTKVVAWQVFSQLSSTPASGLQAQQEGARGGCSGGCE